MNQRDHRSTKPARVALLSYAYAPSVGGIETVSRLVADGLRARNYEVRVVTQTPQEAGGAADEHVIRQPSMSRLWSVLRWSDVVVQSNVSVNLAWPLTLRLIRRPWVAVNHTPIARPSGEKTLRDRLKLASLRAADTYAVSDYLCSVTSARSRVIHNPYDSATFHLPSGPQESREGELLFVGRIVRAKGLDVLIEALHLLRQGGLRPHLCIAGDGDQRPGIEARIAELGMGDQITFLGVLRGEALGRAMRQHRIVVVPSRAEPPEALGLVAVEAIGSGCAVIASLQGGLPEAVGACGLLVPPEKPEALAQAICRALGDEALRQALLSHRCEHLRPFEPETVIDEYEAAMVRAMHQHHRSGRGSPSGLVNTGVGPIPGRVLRRSGGATR